MQSSASFSVGFYLLQLRVYICKTQTPLLFTFFLYINTMLMCDGEFQTQKWTVEFITYRRWCFYTKWSNQNSLWRASSVRCNAALGPLSAPPLLLRHQQRQCSGARGIGKTLGRTCRKSTIASLQAKENEKHMKLRYHSWIKKIILNHKNQSWCILTSKGN